MKKTKSNEVKLGIFVSVGIALLIICIYFIGNRQHLFSTTFRITGVFNDVSGLQVGNNVRFTGINVGTVDNIDIISDTAVKVDMLIDEGVRKFIKKDAHAYIGSDGLMGSRIINISSGSGQGEINKNATIATVTPISMDDIFKKLKSTADNAALITDDMAAITDNIRAGKGTIGKLFMDSTFAQNINQSLVNIKQTSGTLNQDLDNAKHSFLLRGVLKDKKKKDQ